MSFTFLRLSLSCLFFINFIQLILCIGSFLKLDIEDHYDFVVVGGGSAGAVVASRLSENPSIRVLLLEAGESNLILDILSNVPVMLEFMQLSRYDWKYKTEPQSGACLGMAENQCPFPRGKGLGGSSLINYMIYTRGNRRDYDHWAALGNTGWDYSSVLPYFKKSEDYSSKDIELNEQYHRTGGYLPVSESSFRSPLEDAFLSAGQENGLKIQDLNGEYQTGIMNVVGTIRQGGKVTPAKAFLLPANLRPNLVTLQGAHVIKVLFDHDNTAIGVQYKYNDLTHEAYVSKEVILSAGSVNSPQLLMLSGVGPKAELDKFNIPVVANVPGVGENLQDHVSCGGLIWTVDEPITSMLVRHLNFTYILQWVLFGEGPLSLLCGIEGVSFVNTPYANKSDDWPDIEFLLYASSAASDGGLRLRYDFGLSDEVWDQVFEPLVNKETFSILPTLLRPKSRGSIRLQSNNPLDAPLINPNYFNNTNDLEVLVAGMKIALQFGNSSSFMELNAQLNPHIWPGCEKYKIYSDDYLKCLARQYTQTVYNPVGTCKMGPLSTDHMAVVDPQLRVRDVTNLRIVDDSIMPFIVSGNANAPTIMIAEKASDMIKKSWNIPVEIL